MVKKFILVSDLGSYYILIIPGEKKDITITNNGCKLQLIDYKDGSYSS